jgi:hypothetical protein
MNKTLDNHDGISFWVQRHLIPAHLDLLRRMNRFPLTLGSS